jgi:predicted RNA binding protein YcfA (HicA-like mRNA interferase family)
MRLTAVIEREGSGFVALCPELDVASQGSSIEESRVARLRVLSGKEICAILADHGFVEVRRRGSHVVMQKKTEQGTTTVPVPDHKEILLGTLRSIIRQSGVPRKEFEV